LRNAAKVDASQARIVAALRGVGAEVEVMSHVGRGVPDLHVQFKGRLYWLECKNPRPEKKRKVKLTDEEYMAKQLTRPELDFARRFPVHVVTTREEALRVIGLEVAA
jgi:hypothetical protein